MPTGGPRSPGACFFLSDYGTADEFVGVVHAVLHRLAPRGAGHRPLPPGPALRHAARGRPAGPVGPAPRARRGAGRGRPRGGHGPPGRGRRGGVGRARLAGGTGQRAAGPAGPASGGVRAAVALDPAPGWARPGSPRTFDGRDVFAPAAAHLVTGGAALGSGTPVDPATLVGARPVGGEPGDRRRAASGPHRGWWRRWSGSTGSETPSSSGPGGPGRRSAWPRGRDGRGHRRPAPGPGRALSRGRPPGPSGRSGAVGHRVRAARRGRARD